MKKCIVVNFVGLRGGGVSYAYEMVRGLCINGCKVYAIVSNEMESIETWRKIEGIRLIEVNGYSTKFNFIPRLIYFLTVEKKRIRSILKAENVDAVYLPMTSFWAIFVNYVLTGYKKIYTMHDPIPHNKNNIIPNFISDKCARDADAIIILSDVFKEYIHHKYKMPYGKIVTIPLGSQNYYEESKNLGIREKPIIKYDSAKYNFLFYGRITEYKGLHILAQAYEKLSKEFDNITLTVAGNGNFTPYQESYKDLKNFTLINRWIDEQEVYDLFQGKNIITIVPYLTATQSGIIPIAMQFGSPVIASKCGGLIEQVLDNVTGYLVEPGNVDLLYEKMKHIIQHPNEVANIKDAANEYIQKLDWTELTKRVIGIVDKL